LRFLVGLEEIQNSGLVDDRNFVNRVLPLVTGGSLIFLGGCLLRGGIWADCKAQLDECFPYFLRERLIRDLIVIILQNYGLRLRRYI
jgi:hypothetical protein